MKDDTTQGKIGPTAVVDATADAGPQMRVTVLTFSILLLIGILLIFTGYQAAHSERVFFREVALNANQEIATLVGRQFAQTFTNSTGILEDISRFPAARNLDEKSLKDLVNVLLKRHDLFRSIYILDKDGKEWFQQVNIGTNEFRPLPSPLFEKLKRREVSKVLSEFYKSEEAPAITFACPILDRKDTFLGILGAELNLNFIQDILGSVRIGRTGEILLVDRSGSVIFSSPGFRGLEDFKNFKVKKAFLQPKGRGEYNGAKNRLAAHQIIRSLALKPFDPGSLMQPFFNPLTPGTIPDWMVVVQQHSEEAYMVADRMKYNLIILVIVGVIGLVVIARLWSDSL